MPLSIIIVNFRSTQLVLDCLERLYRDPVARTFKVIVVDNASGDNGREAITGAFPGIVWIQMDYNAGFARANNEGIRSCLGQNGAKPAIEKIEDCDAVLLLNGDTLPDAQAIATCYQRLLSSSYVAAGVQLLNADGSPQISGMYVMKGGLNYLLPLPYFGSWIKAAGAAVKVKTPHVADADEEVEVDWVNGAFLMVKRAAIDRAGLLDEDFFLYAEEAEWCSRLKKTGPLCIYGDLSIVHLQGETANQEFGSAGKGYHNLFDRKGLQIMLSNFVRIRKQFGVFWFLVQLFFYCLDIPLFLIGLLFSKKYSFTQWRGYLKNTTFILRLSPVIIRNKPYFYKVL